MNTKTLSSCPPGCTPGTPSGALRGDDGRVVQLLGSIRDITERQRLQVELVQASKLATLGTLSAGMAVELIQPLNIIRLWIDEAARLREAPLEPGHAAPLEQTFALIAEQTVRMRSIIDHMRVFTRREGAAQDFEIVGSVRTAVEMTRRQYVKEDIAVEFDGALGQAGLMVSRSTWSRSFSIFSPTRATRSSSAGASSPTGLDTFRSR